MKRPLTLKEERAKLSMSRLLFLKSVISNSLLPQKEMDSWWGKSLKCFSSEDLHMET